jgi:hypothetical protein
MNTGVQNKARKWTDYLLLIIIQTSIGLFIYPVVLLLFHAEPQPVKFVVSCCFVVSTTLTLCYFSIQRKVSKDILKHYLLVVFLFFSALIAAVCFGGLPNIVSVEKAQIDKK